MYKQKTIHEDGVVINLRGERKEKSIKREMR